MDVHGVSLFQKKFSICLALGHKIILAIVQKINPVPTRNDRFHTCRAMTGFPGRNAAAHGHGHVKFLAADAANGLRRSWLV